MREKIKKEEKRSYTVWIINVYVIISLPIQSIHEIFGDESSCRRWKRKLSEIYFFLSMKHSEE